MDNLASIVLEHRKRSGLTQLELAKLADVGKTVIFDIEHGKETIKFSTLLKILDVLNIKVSFESPIIKSIKGER